MADKIFDECINVIKPQRRPQRYYAQMQMEN